MVMAKLTEKDVLHIAELSKLTLSKAEVEKFKMELDEVLKYFESLKEVELKDIEPTSQTTGLKDVVRVDKTKTENCLKQDEAVSGTDNVYNGYFVVPAVLNNE